MSSSLMFLQLRRLTYPSRFEKGVRIDMDSLQDNAEDGAVVPLRDLKDGANGDAEAQNAANGSEDVEVKSGEKTTPHR